MLQCNPTSCVTLAAPGLSFLWDVWGTSTGEVLAMASRPGFDPNMFPLGISNADWAALAMDELHPLNNRALQGQFPPGSTFKLAMALAGLETGKVTTENSVFCNGGWRFGNRRFNCWKHEGHGRVALHRAIVESCDVYFYQVGQRLGVDGIAEWSRRFGLGLLTGIGLDHEKAGLIPDTEWKRRRFKQPWFAGETLSVAIGQGYVTSTPLQMAQLAAMIGNGGIR